MIVSKAANMADLMKIPVLGLVENMSFVRCPDCGRELKVFGESHIDEVAEKFGYPVLAKLPIGPDIAAMVDAGRIENIESNPIDPAVSVIEKKLD